MMVEARALANDIETEPAPTPLDLRRYLRPGDTVIWGQSCAEARSLILALADQQPAIGPLRCFIGSSIAPLPALDPVAVTFVSYGGGGANRLLDWAGALEILPSRYSALPGLFAERSMPIDVAFVQVTPAEVAGDRYIGAVGGALDFVRGAHDSHGGRPITVLRSMVGSRSTIVGQLSAPVTIPRSDAGIVVTEYGAVDLRGLTLSQRRERPLSIAHPDHRGRLDAISPGPGQIRVVDREQPA